MKILGVFFGQATEADNWQPKLKKLENHLNLWKSRSLHVSCRKVFDCEYVGY